MLSFHPPAVGRDVPPAGAKSLTFNLLVLVLAAVLITASLWFGAEGASATGNARPEQVQKQGIEAAKPHALAHPGHAS